MLKREDFKEWLDALPFEMDSLNKLNTWKLVEPPQDCKAVKTKWVFDLKRDGKENIVRHNTQLAAKGFSRIPGVDFTELFSPVPKYETVRMMLALAV